MVELEERTPGTSATYKGESGFSLQVRGAQHLEAPSNPQSHKDNAFVNHRSLDHREQEQDMQYKLKLFGHTSKPVHWKGKSLKNVRFTVTKVL